MPEPTPDRALKALSDAIDRAVAGDSAEIPVAATVVLLRDSAGGPEVLLLERPDRGSFAGAWVFPGGKLDPEDRHEDDEPEEAVARRAGAREVAEECGLAVASEELVPLSCWNPPVGVAPRIRTWFFAVAAPDGDLTLSPDEVVNAEWVHAADVLGRHGRGELTLYPPTWVTLHRLLEHADADSVLETARLAGAERFQTVARRGAAGPMLLWETDAEYGSDAEASASESRHRLEIGALPWRYSRSD
jgi:8-oxo-dGTP pyrophosphatase MutT (NUDIX family)